MANDHVISGLLQTRAEIAGQIAHLEQHLPKLRQSLFHVDQTLRLVGYDGPDLSVGAKRASTAGLFARREFQRILFGLIRESQTGMTSRQIALRICADKGWDATNKAFVDALVEKIGNWLNRKMRTSDFAVCERRGNDWLWRKR
jgi:hypothetical protein